MTKEARSIHISGIVQGVGFRPYVYRASAHFELCGWVLNASDGVHIHVEGESEDLESFIGQLRLNAPIAARIDELRSAKVAPEGFDDFCIRESATADSTHINSAGSPQSSANSPYASTANSPQSSANSPQINTLVSPDIATCPECVSELFDEGNRRYHYPFINCTNCGPRFTIIERLPYDRAATSMADFVMCDPCASEYANPADRRFHAQPDACFDCGPQLQLGGAGMTTIYGDSPESSDLIIRRTAELLRSGKIVAIKSLGGYHLACDASDEWTVAELRRRKRRPNKPLAVMMATLDEAQQYCNISELEASTLSGTARPIVLLERKAGNHSGRFAGIAPSVFGELSSLGVMLPYTPLQHLLMAEAGIPLVMTSGNMSEEPIISDEWQAHELLGGIADAFLDNNREIVQRYDDSVVRVINEQLFIVRRARGYAPLPLALEVAAKTKTQLQPMPQAVDTAVNSNALAPLPSVLATGAEQKNTFCLASDGRAFVSQHLGDLESSSNFFSWQGTLDLYKQLFDIWPQVIAHDIHPEYLTSKWAHAQDEPRVAVQHHHAHIAAVLAENGWCKEARAIKDSRVAGLGKVLGGGAAKATGRSESDGLAAPADASGGARVIGIAFDGTGYGDDGTIWGGEILLCNALHADRFAHLKTAVMPGGAAAIKHPNRMAWSYIRQAGLTGHPGVSLLAESLEKDRSLLLDQIIDKRINSPLTSSMGRLFDAVAAMLGIRDTCSYEGQAAMELEAALMDCPADATKQSVRYRFKISEPSEQDVLAAQTALGKNDEQNGVYIISYNKLLEAILDDIQKGLEVAVISQRFHDAVVKLIVDMSELARKRSGISAVALGGGVFTNRYLLTKSLTKLEQAGFKVLVNRQLPAGDGSISYGQAAVALAQLSELRKQGIILEAS